MESSVECSQIVSFYFVCDYGAEFLRGNEDTFFDEESIFFHTKTRTEFFLFHYDRNIVNMRKFLYILSDSFKIQKNLLFFLFCFL